MRAALVTLVELWERAELGSLPVELSADPELWAAHLKLLAFLIGRDRGSELMAVPRRVNVIGVVGIGTDGDGKPYVFQSGRSLRFRAREATGLAVLADRSTYVTLSRPELAALLGSLPAELSADPELWAAYLRLLAFLAKDRPDS
jgi:hypothetical protein